MALDIIILVAAVLAVIAVYYFLKTVKHLIVNTILGLIILVLSQYVFNVGLEITPIVILICAIGGVPGALLVLLLHMMGIAF
ncbi:MAG: pro-sigmaK processing inhibitor BofA family protein [Candidatus Methanoperedenaceae archaeon]|nr:pro-sigmaK processing inhibitor BofA family protein [Candidatus Methanoperedenaceae archaeon]MDW7725594.1 pro-sigmaK processing inhibitor BofA family protein [Candidatus Methanoperedens sp.]